MSGFCSILQVLSTRSNNFDTTAIAIYFDPPPTNYIPWQRHKRTIRRLAGTLFVVKIRPRDCDSANNCPRRIYEARSNALLMQSRGTLTRFCNSLCFEGDNFGDRPRLLIRSTRLPFRFVIEVKFPGGLLILHFPLSHLVRFYLCIRKYRNLMY